jgi:hypothetical protein
MTSIRATDTSLVTSADAVMASPGQGLGQPGIAGGDAPDVSLPAGVEASRGCRDPRPSQGAGSACPRAGVRPDPGARHDGGEVGHEVRAERPIATAARPTATVVMAWMLLGIPAVRHVPIATAADAATRTWRRTAGRRRERRVAPVGRRRWGMAGAACTVGRAPGRGRRRGWQGWLRRTPRTGSAMRRRKRWAGRAGH